MIPGLTTKISEQYIALETTIQPSADLLIVNSTTSTTVLTTIAPPFGGFSGVSFLYNKSGAAITAVTTGNVVAAQTTIPDGALVVLVYSQNEQKYIVGSTN